MYQTQQGSSATRPAYDSQYHSQSSRYSYSHPYNNPTQELEERLNPDQPNFDDEGFDVRADFDGEGPRWSRGYSSNMKQDDASSYRPVSSHLAPSGAPSAKEAQSKEELVSVPVLGPEWQRSELHDMSRRGKSEVKKEKRNAAWKMWTRDQRGLCGIRWMTRKALVFFLFALVVALAITLFFTIPRAPSFTFYNHQPFIVDNSTIAFSRTPANFSFSGNLNLLADSTPSYLPVHFSHLQATLYDLDTDNIIATGDYGNHVVPRGKNEPVVLPVTFSYSALNASDATWNDMYNACGHIWQGTDRSDLQFRLELKMSIIGLVTHPVSETQISKVGCPFELPANSV